MPMAYTEPRDYRSRAPGGQPKAVKDCICSVLLLVLNSEIVVGINSVRKIPFDARQGLTFAIGVSTLCFLLACSSSPKTGDPTSKKAMSGTDESIFLGDTIEKNYDPNVIMKRGEAFFEKEEFAEAIVEYNHFLDLHRNHMLASYAAFRVGESQMKRAKGIERDPEPIQKAIDSFERLRRDYPASRYDGQAVDKLQECHDLLAQMHLFVGQFYYRRGSFLAAAHRFEQIMKIYPDKSVAPDALYFLAMSYHDLGADDWASEKLTLLAEKYPNSAHSSEGKRLLAKIMKSQPSVVVAKKPDAAPSAAGPAVAESQHSAPAGGVTPQVANGLMRLPSATAMGQGFVSCRLGAWC
jgi:outer membrane protein assembly factor BamD